MEEELIEDIIDFADDFRAESCEWDGLDLNFFFYGTPLQIGSLDVEDQVEWRELEERCREVFGIEHQAWDL